LRRLDILSPSGCEWSGSRGLGGLGEAIDGFTDAVGNLGLEPAEDTPFQWRGNNHFSAPNKPSAVNYKTKNNISI
jgi:hypothetical protein